MRITKVHRLALLGVAFLLVVGFLFSVTRFIPENRTYIIGWEEGPPDQVGTTSGEPTGFAVELVREAAKRRAIRLQWVLHPESSEAALLTKTVDLWPMMVITEGRKQLFHLTDPYEEDEFGLFVDAKSAYTRADDLKQQRIAYDGTPFDAKLLREHFPRSTPLPMHLLAEAVKSVCDGEAQAFFEDQTSVFSILLSNPPCPDTSLRMLLVPPINVQLGIGATRESAAAADAIREEIGVMSSDGSLRRIAGAWSHNASQEVASLLMLQQAKSRLRWYRIGFMAVGGLLAFASWSAAGYRRQKMKSQAYSRALGQAERNVRLVTDSLTEMVVAYDTHRNLTFANSGAEKLTGYGLAELHVASPLAWTDPEDRPQMVALWDQVFAGQTVNQVVHRLITKDGTVKWVAGSWGPLTDEMGRPVGIRGTCQDITERVVAERLLEETTQKFRTIVEEIAERKRAEEALRENEQRLVLIYNTVRDVIFHLAIEPDGQFRFVSVNAAFLRVTGLSLERVVGKTVNEVIPEPSLTMVLGKYRQAVEEKTIVLWEETSDYPTGRLTGEVSVAPVFDHKGRCTHLVGSVHDITERKQAEEMRSHLAAIVESSDDAIMGKTLDGAIVSWNPGAERMYGYKAKEVVGKPVSLLVPPDRPDEIPQILERLRHGEGLEHYETTRVRKDGRRIEVSVTISPISDRAGAVVGASVITRDITDQKRAEAELRESEERFRNMADTAPVMIWVTDPDKRFTFFNKTWLDFTGRTMEQELGNGWAEGVHPEDRDRCFASFSSSFDARQDFQIECRLRRADGEYRWVLCTGVPRFALGGVFAGYIGSDVDTTDQRRAEATLRRNLDEIAHLNRAAAMGELTASIAHEVNQPLAAILSNAQAASRFLGGESPDLAEVRECLTDIIADDKRAGAVIQRLRALLKKGEFQASVVDLNEVVGEVIRLVGHDALLRNALIRFEPLPGLHPVLGDRIQLNQVVLNLIINGLEAASDPAPRDRWLLVRTAESNSGTVELTVEDSGKGIAESDLSRVFEPFFTTKQKGLGMGLSISRSIVQAHGGRIWAERSAGHGAIFHCMLPGAQQGAAAATL